MATIKHEAAHFLIAYLSGIPVSSYSLGLMEMHAELLEAKIEKSSSGGGDHSGDEVLAVVAMSGVAAEQYFGVATERVLTKVLQKANKRNQN